MNEYHEVHEIEEVMLSNREHHMTKMKNERAEIQEIENDAVKHTSSQKSTKKFYMYLR